MSVKKHVKKMLMIYLGIYFKCFQNTNNYCTYYLYFILFLCIDDTSIRDLFDGGISNYTID